MQGPRLTRGEVVGLLRHEVDKLVSLGAGRPDALRMVARKHRVPTERVVALIAPETRVGAEQ